MITKEDLKQLNIARDKNLERKLNEQTDKLFSYIQREIADIPAHKTSPNTEKELNKITNCYSLQGAKLTTMEEQLIEIKKGLDENRLEHREITEDGRKQHQETMDKLEEMSKTKADQVYVTKLETNLNNKAEKESFTELKKLVYWVLAFLASNLVGTIWFLLSNLLDKS
jgi:hypothetical protein